MQILLMPVFFACGTLLLRMCMFIYDTRLGLFRSKYREITFFIFQNYALYFGFQKLIVNSKFCNEELAVELEIFY